MASSDPEPRFETLVVRSGHSADLHGARPTAIPLHNASSFHFASAAELDQAFDGSGYVYSRFANPTVAALESALARLEGAEAAVAFASGMAALHAAIVACIRGSDDLLVAGRDCYGGTQGLILGPLASLGVQHRFVDLTSAAEIERTLAERPRAVLLETMSNPLLRVVDLPALAERAREVGTLLIVDSTFTTPYLCRPLALGADLVVHSATKYLSGHGDVTAGLVAGRLELMEPVRRVARLVGGVLGPNEAWLTLRGLRTLALRVQRQCDNASRLAEWLEQQPRVGRVYFPGLRSHPQHALAGDLFRNGFGAVVSFDLEPSNAEAASAFMDQLTLFTPAPTVGDLESLVMHPPRASHRGLSEAERAEIGIGPGLVRLSIGIEAVEDLIADVAQALER